MPGPISDSYDPEFGTGHNAHVVRQGLQEVVAKVSEILTSDRQYIVDVVEGEDGPMHTVPLTERELRIIRFGLERAAESV
jgi:hypothetical protein